jgi:MFS family permease
MDLAEARRCRASFHVLSFSFGLNHATVTTPINYATSILVAKNGNLGNAMLYFATLVCSLFFSASLFSILGSKVGLVISMGAYAAYVGLFALSASFCTEYAEGTCHEAGPAQLQLVLLGSAIGGIGAGLLWTCQGAFFAAACERIAAAEMKEPPAVTAELGGKFALVFLAWECIMRISATVLTTYLNLSYVALFYTYMVLAFVATLTFALMGGNMQSANPSPPGSICGKAAEVVKLWKDPKLLLLQFTNVAFGFAAAYLGSYINPQILSKALDKKFIGLMTGILSGLAAVLARLLAPVATHVGKGPVMAIGSAAFILMVLLSYIVTADWGWGVVIFYILMGIGRAVYESTNKAVFADFFPGPKSVGAFANVFVFGTSASTTCFMMGSAKLYKEEGYALLFFAFLTVPCFLLARSMKVREELASGANGPLM